MEREAALFANRGRTGWPEQGATCKEGCWWFPVATGLILQPPRDPGKSRQEGRKLEFRGLHQGELQREAALFFNALSTIVFDVNPLNLMNLKNIS